MKKTLPLLLLLLASLTATSQTNNLPSVTDFSIRFESQHGEAFSVFIDGELQNRLPQSRVLVNQVSNQTHEVVVVMKRPAEKCAVMHLRPKDRTVVVNINYDTRLEQLYLFTPTQNRVEMEEKQLVSRPIVQTTSPRRERLERSPKPADTAAVRIVNDEEMEAMELRLKSQTFESDRLALAKVLVAATPMTAEQIKRLTATLDYSNSMVDLLKYSYYYCVDPENYYITVDVLTFTSDKKKVLDYIATQK